MNNPVNPQLLLCIGMLLGSIPQTTQQVITLSDNGYEGVLVAISDHISQEQYPRLLDKLQVGHFSSTYSFYHSMNNE